MQHITSGHRFVYGGRDKSSRELQWGGPASTVLWFIAEPRYRARLRLFLHQASYGLFHLNNSFEGSLSLRTNGY